MGRAVLISIRPKWCDLIAGGKKTIEVRKTAPKIETPFKCYIYCTKFRPGDPDSMINLKGRKSFFMSQSCMVIAEFMCRTIEKFDSAWSEYAYAVAPPGSVMPMHEAVAIQIMKEKGCLTNDDITGYFGDEDYKASFWHISDLKIYDVPRAISEFTGLKKTRFGYAPYVITRPPQSWCYVEQGD